MPACAQQLPTKRGEICAPVVHQRGALVNGKCGRSATGALALKRGFWRCTKKAPPVVRGLAGLSLFALPPPVCPGCRCVVARFALPAGCLPRGLAGRAFGYQVKMNRNRGCGLGPYVVLRRGSNYPHHAPYGSTFCDWLALSVAMPLACCLACSCAARPCGGTDTPAPGACPWGECLELLRSA